MRLLPHLIHQATNIFLEERAHDYYVAGTNDNDDLIFYDIWPKNAPILGSLYQAQITHIDKATRMAHIRIKSGKNQPIQEAMMKSHNNHEGQTLWVQLTKYPRLDKIYEMSQHITLEGRYWRLQKGKDALIIEPALQHTIDATWFENIDFQNRATLKKTARSASIEALTAEYTQYQTMLNNHDAYQPHIWQDIIHFMHPNAALYVASPTAMPAIKQYAAQYPDIVDSIYQHIKPTTLWQQYYLDAMIQNDLQEVHYVDNGSQIHIYETPALCVIDIDQGNYQSALSDKAIIDINKQALHDIMRLIGVRQIGGMIVVDLIKPKNKLLLKDIMIYSKQLINTQIVHIHGVTKMGLLELHIEKNNMSLWERDILHG